MTHETRNNYQDLARQFAPNVLLLIGMWWFSITTARNSNVDKQEVLLQGVIERLEKIEQRLDRAEQDRYDRLEQEMSDLRKAITND